MISLIGATTFPVEGAGLGNLPSIVGDGKHDDTGGLSALMHGEPLVFETDACGAEGYRGVVFHRGVYRVTNTITVPEDARIRVERIVLEVSDLDLELPVFSVEKRHRATFAGVAGEVHYVGRKGRTLFLAEYGRAKQRRSMWQG
jgi:hypothetical protein